MRTLSITNDQLADLASCLSFTIAEYQRVRKDKAPNFIKDLKAIDKKVWKEIRRKK